MRFAADPFGAGSCLGSARALATTNFLHCVGVRRWKAREGLPRGRDKQHARRVRSPDFADISRALKAVPPSRDRRAPKGILARARMPKSNNPPASRHYCFLPRKRCNRLSLVEH